MNDEHSLTNRSRGPSSQLVLQSSSMDCGRPARPNKPTGIDSAPQSPPRVPRLSPAPKRSHIGAEVAPRLLWATIPSAE